MKSSFRKLRGFSLGRHGGKDKQHGAPGSSDDAATLSRQPQHRRRYSQPPQLDEVARATQDLQDMKECYEGLMSSSARTSNSVFEFSESLQDLGTCLLTKSALNMDEDSGRVLIMLGKAQYELHKLFDHYRVQIARTITKPSDILLAELSNVEEMKDLCADKRKLFETLSEERAKAKSKFHKGEHISAKQLLSAEEDYEQQVILLVCRLKSLKQGQPRSLLVQAARHYTAQLQLFRKGLAALEALEPLVKQIAEQQHIDHQLAEIEEDDGEISFELNDHDYDDTSSSEHSMQLDGLEESKMLHISSSQMQLSPERIEHRTSASRNSIGSTKSAPLATSIYRKSGVIDKVHDANFQPNIQKNLYTYALPTPEVAKSGNLTGLSNVGSATRHVYNSEVATAQWHSSPLDKTKNPSADTNLASTRNEPNPNDLPEHQNMGLAPINGDETNAQQLPDETGANIRTNFLPPPIKFDTPGASDSKRIKRLAQSGPLAGKSWFSQSTLNASEPLLSRQTDTSKYGFTGRSSISRANNSSKISPSVSPSNLSPPHGNKLYELPKPPSDPTKIPRSSERLPHSAPLTAKKTQDSSLNLRVGQPLTKTASPLPPPPGSVTRVTRSFSIPSRGQTDRILQSPKLLKVSARTPNVEEGASPPLTPISFHSEKEKKSTEEVTGENKQLLDMVVNNVPSHGSSISSELG